ncbi:MAG: epoxyqueuosine reductase [Candidatus Aerophobus sp.]|nr:MAG: epoxyqueuosine reductase [Candidatus Aerophobus sp.]
MPNNGSKQEIREFALSRGATIIGVASEDRFSEAPPGHRPRDFLKSARSVIVMGVGLLPVVVNWHKFLENSSYLSGQKRRRAAWYVYHVGAYLAVNSKLNSLGLDLSHFLYHQGSATMFLPATGGGDWTLATLAMHHPDRYKWTQSSEGEETYMAEFSHRHAAVLAGLGRLGANNLVLTPNYGPRMRFISVITEAEFDPEPLIQKELCLWEKGCRKCVEDCPFQAFGSPWLFEIGGSKMTLAKFSPQSCYDHNEGADNFGCGGICINSCPVGRPKDL